MKQTFAQIAEKLIEQLNQEGFEAYLWHAGKGETSSAYIRFKNPMLCSIRLADHPGKQKLRYKYNVRSDITKSYQGREDGAYRFYFTVNDIDLLIDELRTRRQLTKEWKPKYQYGIPSWKKNPKQ
jgi:hypothetical protein